MSHYKRSKTGHLFFFTVVTWKRRHIFYDPDNRALLGGIIREVQGKHLFSNEAFVLLPDHLHCIWHLPDSDYSMRWGLIKKEFTKRLSPVSGYGVPDAVKRRGEGAIWQRRFWEHTIRDEKDYENHCHYIHYNPVKHGYVKYPTEWEFSSFHRFVRQGRYTPYWCASEKEFEGFEVGE